MIEKTVVVFRYDMKHGDVTAMFPLEPVGVTGALCRRYSGFGGKSATDSGYLIKQTRPATPKQYKKLAVQLCMSGYRLDIRKRVPANAWNIRIGKVKAMERGEGS